MLQGSDLYCHGLNTLLGLQLDVIIIYHDLTSALATFGDAHAT